MKDLLDILQKADSLPKATLFVLAVCAIAYLAYFVWKNHLAESAVLETKKRKLELIKLGLEIEELRKKNPSPRVGVHQRSPDPVETLGELLQETKKDKERAALESFARHPFKFVVGLFAQRVKWLRFFFAGGFAASVYPVAIICYNFLHLPQNISANDLQMVLWLQLGFLALAVILGAIIAAIWNLGDLSSALMVGLFSGLVLFHLASLLLGLILKISLVFLNAH